MPYNNLNILVLLRETGDPRPPAHVITRGASIAERGLRRVPNPSDLTALEEALRLKDNLGATVTALAIGPERLDDILHLASSMGADRLIRFWDHGCEGGDAVADARLLSRILKIMAPTLVFTGNRLTDQGDDPSLALAAALVDMPCISSVVAMTLKKENVEALRKGDRGSRQRMVAPFPCTVMFEEGEAPRYPSVDAVIASQDVGIEAWDLSHLGLPFWETGALGASLTTAEFGTPRPDPVRVATPDATLPAFERILSLLSGGIKAREGKQHHLSADDTVAGLWQIFHEEGLVEQG